MVNRNAGSGTRVLIDRLLEGRQPPGYAVQTKSHNAVAAAIAQGRADWGVAIASAAAQAGLQFLPLTAERYDFAVPRSRRARPGVRALADLLEDAAIQERLAALGLTRDG
jgi:putative molybdopterin biosynthesis protein